MQERLDRVFTNMSWWTLFPLCKLTAVTIAAYDHDVILLELLNVTIPKRVFRFKFENTWLKDPTFVQDVKKMLG